MTLGGHLVSSKAFVFWVLGVMLSSNAAAQDLALPDIKPGDAWTYLTTTQLRAKPVDRSQEEFSVSGVTDSSIHCSVKKGGSKQPPGDLYSGRDWSRVRAVNGVDTVVNRPLSFPLSIGKTWDLEYTEQQPNKNHRWEKFSNKYVVVGFDSVEVPAGKFKALKIEVKGQWTAELASDKTEVQRSISFRNGSAVVTQSTQSVPRVVSGEMRKAIWYAPEVKRWVKTVEEYDASGGGVNERHITELLSYKAD
jgi:hypothetical protein